jgi:peptidoglycan-N-acetylglucosamine deacetylase
MVTDADRQPPAGDWRRGAAAAAELSFDVDAEAPILAEGDHYAEDLSSMSHQAYGPRVGVPRILELLAAREIEATFFLPGVTAERWPGTVEEILQSGHEVALHGYSHRVLPGMSEQRRDLEMGLETLYNLGVEPRGYRAPY